MQSLKVCQIVIKDYIHKIRITPIHRLFLGLFKKIYHLFYFFIIELKYNYLDNRFDFQGKINASILKKYQGKLTTPDFKKVITNYLNHKFDLLGSGIVKVDYQVKPKGVENYKYYKSLNIKKFDNKGDWLNILLLKYHIKKSKKCWQLIDKNYIPIDWQQDFKSGYRWGQKIFYKKIRTISKNKLGADIKVPWELARCQHLPQMALFSTNIKNVGFQKRIIREFKNQVLDFIMTNPVGMGVNWVCAMDIAIRAANWLFAYDLLKKIDKYNILDDAFNNIFYDSIYIHGKFIRNNLEWSPIINSNHYLSDIAGLFIIALYLNHKKWYKFTLKELKREIKKQFYPDGTNFEGSTCYHRLSTELVFYPVYFAVLKDNSFNGKNFIEIGQKIFGKDYITQLYNIFNSFFYLLKPNGLMPQIGDNDSGQLFKLYPREVVLDMRYIISIGAVFFMESKWKIKGFFKKEEDLSEIKVLFGKEGLDIWKNLKWNDIKNIKSKNFDNSGWYVLRNNNNYIIVSCAANNPKGNGAHCHNDKLSFEMMVKGKDIIIDPGTYLYTPLPEWRNRFRSVSSHNTIIFKPTENGNIIEQNKFNNFFSMENNIKCEKIKFSQNKFIGKVVHKDFKFKREFVLLNNGVEIKNHFIYKNQTDWYNNFVLAPDIKLNKLLINNKSPIKVDSCYISRYYGNIMKSKKLKLNDKKIKIIYKDK